MAKGNWMIFSEELKKRTDAASAVLEKYGRIVDDSHQKTVMSAMEYSLFSGGKRLRPVLMREAFTMCGGTGTLVEPFMAAIEMIHTYSLVHDDLPAMDNDDYRRGRKTCHVVYGEDMAILAGDALLNFAYETALRAFDQASAEEAPRVARALRVLAKKSGIFGMVGGQTVDVEAERLHRQLTDAQLRFVFELKTAALMEAALMIGAILAGAEESTVAQFESIARKVGIAFQIQDDILDVTSTQEVLGKPIGSDQKNRKTTYVALHGIEASKQVVETYSKQAIDELNSLPDSNDFLKELVLSLIGRIK